jgi:hypothetical protein
MEIPETDIRIVIFFDDADLLVAYPDLGGIGMFNTSMTPWSPILTMVESPPSKSLPGPYPGFLFSATVILVHDSFSESSSGRIPV